VSDILNTEQAAPMAAVDFSLEDIRRILIEDVRGIMLKDIRDIVDESIDARFRVFEAGHEEDMRAIQEDFLGVFNRLDNVEEGLQDVKHEVKAANRLLSQHSRDIMQLRAAQGL
jgi:hypothetical protein